MPRAQISLTLSRHFSLSFISSGRSSGLHPVSSHSCWMYIRAGRPDFARPYVGIHRSISLMSSSLLLRQCPACLVCLTWIVFVMGGSNIEQVLAATPNKAPTIQPPLLLLLLLLFVQCSESNASSICCVSFRRNKAVSFHFFKRYKDH